MTDADDPYLAVHVRERLVADERVGEQDLRVHADAHCIHVSGTVSTAARREAVVTVVGELAPGWEICNEVEVLDVAPRPDVEDVTG